MTLHFHVVDVCGRCLTVCASCYTHAGGLETRLLILIGASQIYAVCVDHSKRWRKGDDERKQGKMKLLKSAGWFLGVWIGMWGQKEEEEWGMERWTDGGGGRWWEEGAEEVVKTNARWNGDNDLVKPREIACVSFGNSWWLNDDLCYFFWILVIKRN